MQQLIEGYRAFRSDRWQLERERYLALSRDGQRPQTLVIACSDSRTDPAVIFSARPGSMFVIRNVAAIVPPYEPDSGYHGTSAAIAFAVLNLEVQSILVMGHAQCGGVAAAVSPQSTTSIPFLHAWINLLAPAVEKLAAFAPHGCALDDLERETVRLSMARLMTFPFVSERVAFGKLEINGARFGIADGVLELLGADGVFARVNERGSSAS